MSDEDGPSEADAINTVLSGGALVFGGRIVKLVFLFVVEIFLARILGVSSYGGVVLGMMVVSVGTLVAHMGVPAGLVRKIAYYDDEPVQARGILQAGIFLSLAGGVVVGLAAFVLAPVLARRVFDDPGLTNVLRVAALAIPFSVLASTGVSIAKGSTDAKTHVVVNQIIKPVARFALVAAFVLAGFEAVGAMAGVVGAMVVGAVAALYLAYRTISFEPVGERVRKYRELLTFSVPLMFASTMTLVLTNTDQLLLGAFLSSSAVGLYTPALKLRSISMIFFHPATYLLSPVITKLDKNDENAAAKRTYQVITKWTVLLTLPLFVLILLFPELVIGLTFGNAYTEATLALQLLILSNLVTVTFGANGNALVALGHNRINLYVNSGVAVLNVVLNVLLIPRFGIVGAGFATAASYVARDLLYTVKLYQWHGIHPFSRAMLRSLVVVLVLAPLAHQAFVRVAPVTLVSVAAFGLVAFAVYVPLVVLVGGIESIDVRTLSDLVDSAGIDHPWVTQFVEWAQS